VVSWGQMHLKFGQLNLIDFDLYDLVGRIFGSETLNSIAKGNTLINNVPSGTVVHSDERALEFILRNLVSNANKFTQNGSISVDVKREGIKTTLWISDTGVGMLQEKAATLFGGDVTSTLGTNKEKGSGLGLLLVKEFVERLNGSIAVESQINRGTTIRIEL